MKIVCIIPARLGSQRFPRKILALLKGKPLIQWVWEAATNVPLFDDVIFAVDAQETADVITAFGGTSYMTSESCRSGTLRLAEVAQTVSADIYVNWQGDEPFLSAAAIGDLLQLTHHGDIWTLKKKIVNSTDLNSPHIVKVVTDIQGKALYFSRSPIPHGGPAFKHIGVYAYTAAALKRIAHLPPSPLEEAEKLEQLTFLYHGLNIFVHETAHEGFGIDLPEHLAQAESYLKNLHV